MSISLGLDSTVQVRAIVRDDTNAVITNTNSFEITLADLATALNGGPNAAPTATPTAAGIVRQAVAVPNQAALTVTGADAAAVATSATTAVTALVTKVNAILAALRTAGIVVN